MMIVAKSDYIFNANNVYYNLNKHLDVFKLEANIINYAKCVLLRNEELDDFIIDNTYVDVYNNSNGYDLYFDEYILSIEVYDKQIIDLKLKK